MSKSRERHGERFTRLYNTWCAMKSRCKGQAHFARYYSPRGISYDPAWENYTAFRSWALANGYRDDLTIERKDVNGDYTPDNCTFIPFEEQVQNRRKPTTCRGDETTSSWKGVSWQGGRSIRWAAQIRFKKERIRLGLYTTEIEAAFAYNVASEILFHEWAAKNDIPSDALSHGRKEAIKADVTRRISSKLGASSCESTTR